MDASLGPTSGHKWIHSMYTIKRFVDFFGNKCGRHSKNVETYGVTTLNITESSSQSLSVTS